MIIATWNVLHHVHGVNWGDLPASPSERERGLAIAARVRELLGFSLAVCLQEVSGDQLRALKAAHAFSLALPRVPRLRNGTAVLEDATEHLVVLSERAGRVVEQHAFATDPGKGFIAVRLEHGPVVVSTHVSYGERAAAQLQTLAAWVRAQAGHAVIVAGDFNADRDAVMTALGPGFSIAPLPKSSRPSRPRTTATGKSQQIDHVIGHLAAAAEAGVEDGLGLSDHNPVWSKFA